MGLLFVFGNAACKNNWKAFNRRMSEHLHNIIQSKLIMKLSIGDIVTHSLTESTFHLSVFIRALHKHMSLTIQGWGAMSKTETKTETEKYSNHLTKAPFGQNRPKLAKTGCAHSAYVWLKPPNSKFLWTSMIFFSSHAISSIYHGGKKHIDWKIYICNGLG